MTVQQLNLDPLNQAALQRLRREHLPNRPDHLYLLQLGLLGLEEEGGQSAREADDRRDLFQDYLRSLVLQQSALEFLQEDLSPQEVLHQPLGQLSQELYLVLRGQNQPPP